MLIHNADITGSLLVNGTPFNTGSFSGSFTGIVAGTTATASYVEYNSVANKPALVSGSSQITYSGLTGIPSGIVSGSAQVTYSGLTGIPSGIVSGSAQVTYSGLTGVPSGIVSGSSQVTYSGLTGIPSGIVSGSAQVTYSGLTGTPSGIVSGSAQVASFGIFATTGSNGFNGSQSITGSLTVTGQVVAQTLNVQQVTSSVVYSSGSNVFGNSLANTQQFTGSVGVTGSLTSNGALNGTIASFTGDITVHSGLGTSVLNIGGANGDYASAIKLIGNNTFKNWEIGSNTGVQGSLEIRSSTVAGGTSFTTPIFSLSSTGAAIFSGSVAVGTNMSIGTSGTNNISWNTGGGIKLSRTNIGPEDTLTQRWTGTLAYVDIAASSQWNGGVTILPNGGGNVGIGTLTPGYKLEIQTSSTSSALWVQTGGTTSSYTIADFRTGTNLPALRILGDGTATFGSSVTATSGAFRAPNNVVGSLLVKGGKDDVTNVGEINSQIDFGSNDSSVSNEGNIGGRIASVTEFSNGAFTGLAFYTYQQGRSPDLKEAMRISNDSSVAVTGNLSTGGAIQLSGTITNNNSGTGVYTRAVWYNDTSNQVLFENGRQTDDVNGTGRTVYFTWRGGPSVGGGVQLQHGTNAWAAYTSDARLKTKVADISNGLEAILKLEPIKFKWTRELEKSKTVTGFTAQNIEQAIPDAVFNSWQDEELGDVKSYYQDYLTPYLVKAIQELKSELDTAKAEIQLLKQQ